MIYSYTKQTLTRTRVWFLYLARFQTDFQMNNYSLLCLFRLKSAVNLKNNVFQVIYIWIGNNFIKLGYMFSSSRFVQ